MSIYFLTIVILILFRFLLKENYDSSSGKRAFCIFAALQLALLSGLRHITVGADTLQYKIGKWDVILQKGWKELLSNLGHFLLNGYRYRNEYNYNVEEPMYDLFQKTCQLFTTNYQVYLVIIGFVIAVPMSVSIYRYSKDPLISYILFYSLFWNFMGITGICQTIAMTLTAYGGFHLLKKGKLISYLALVLVASLFHKSAFIAVLMLPCMKMKISKLYSFIIICGFGLIFLFKDIVLKVLANSFGYGRYGEELFAGYNFLLIYFVIVLLSCWKYRSIPDCAADRIVYYSCLLGLCIIPIGRSGIRAAQYFTLYLLILLPELLEHLFLSKRETWLFKTILILAMLLLFFKDKPSYKFFWQ